MSDKVWAVIYLNESQKLVIKLFNNKESAYECYEYFIGDYYLVDVYECKVHNQFEIC